MRGINTQTRKIRERVFEEVARAAFHMGDGNCVGAGAPCHGLVPASARQAGAFDRGV